MKINLVNTSDGFRCYSDDDYENKRKLKIGAVYETTIKEYRNIKFHRLYFSLINCAWAYLTEQQQEFFHSNIQSFRKCVEVSAGHSELCYSIARKEWIEIPRSIAFDKLSESDFSALYERIKDVLYKIFLTSVNKNEFENQLKYY